MALGIRLYDVICVSLWPYVSGSTTYWECEFVALGIRQYYIIWVLDCGLRYLAVLHILIWVRGLRYSAVLHTLIVRKWPYVSGSTTYGVCVFVALIIQQDCIFELWDCGLRHQAVRHTLSVSLWPWPSVSTIYCVCEVVALGIQQYNILWVWICGICHTAVLHTLCVRLWP